MIKYSLALAAIVFSNVSVAAIFPTSQILNEKIAYVCDGDISETMRCSDINNQYLITSTKLRVGPAFNPECSMNPNDPTCPNERIRFGDVFYTTFNARTGSVTKSVVKVTPSGNTFSPQNFVVQSSTPTSSEIAQAEELYQLNEQYKTLQKRYTFSQVGDQMVNLLGENMSNLSGQHTSIANCHTATSYPNSSESDSSLAPCDGFLNNYLSNIHNENRGLSDFYDSLSKWEATVTLRFVSVKIFPKRDNKFKLSFKFSDNSILVLEITDNGKNNPPTIILDKDGSKDSQGRSLRSHQSITQASWGEFSISGAELESWSLLNGCSYVRTTIGYDQRLKVQVIERAPDGRPTRWKITAISYTPVFDQVYTCG